MEIYNRSGAAVDLSGFHLSTDRANLAGWTMPAGTSIPARAFRAFTESETGLSFTGLELGVYLARPDLSEVISAQAFDSAPGHVPSLAETSDACFPDGEGPFSVSTTPTRGVSSMPSVRR